MESNDTGATGFSWDMLRQARQAASAAQQTLVTVLAAQQHLGERETVTRLALVFGWREIDTAAMQQLRPLFDRLPLAMAMTRHVLLMTHALESTDPVIAVLHDPLDADLQTWARSMAGGKVEFRLALKADIDAYLSKQEEAVRAVDTLVAAEEPEEPGRNAVETLSFASVSAQASPAVRLVSSTLYDAFKAGASDVHLESTPQGLAIKFRVDGVLDAAGMVSGIELAQQVISRLKVLAELDIAERRVPQDGSFRVRTEDREIDLRLSIMPSALGEDAVIRVLDKRGMMQLSGLLTLDALGLDSSALGTLRALAQQAYGMLLVTGPTGSGKTTTLYGALSERNGGREKIITIEDPVEYQLPGVLQIPVNDRKGLTFARGLRSILRHDPDIIMVGEIRDTETAEIAVQSALTGHLVFSTVHANSVFDVFSRFTHMGVDPYAFASALNGIWAQRLVRINCPRCSGELPHDAEDWRRVRPQQGSAARPSLRRGAGCGDCRGTGFKGRRAIAEVLVLDDELRELIVQKAPVRQLKEVAHRTGTRSLREAALALVHAGQTTLDEIQRVTVDA